MKTDFRGIFKPETRGKYFGYFGWKIILLRIVKFIQKTLWICSIAVYDPVFGECTPDFNCCGDYGRKAFIRFHKKGK